MSNEKLNCRKQNYKYAMEDLQLSGEGGGHTKNHWGIRNTEEILQKIHNIHT